MRFRIRRWALQCGGTRCLIPVVWIISSCSSQPTPHREISAGGLVLSVLNDHTNNCFLINIEGWMSANGEREKSVSQQAVFFPLGWAGGKVAKSKPGGEKVVETCWQGLGCDGGTPSLRFPVLSRTPPIIAELTVRSRAGLCGWAMGAVSFLPTPSPADWFPWQEPPLPSQR